DKHERTSKRKSGRDATLAESGHDVGFRRAGQASLGQPFRQFGEGGFVHTATIQPRRPLMALGNMPLNLSICVRFRYKQTCRSINWMSALRRSTRTSNARIEFFRF